MASATKAEMLAFVHLQLKIGGWFWNEKIPMPGHVLLFLTWRNTCGWRVDEVDGGGGKGYFTVRRYQIYRRSSLRSRPFSPLVPSVDHEVNIFLVHLSLILFSPWTFRKAKERNHCNGELAQTHKVACFLVECTFTGPHSLAKTALVICLGKGLSYVKTFNLFRLDWRANKWNKERTNGFTGDSLVYEYVHALPIIRTITKKRIVVRNNVPWLRWMAEK